MHSWRDFFLRYEEEPSYPASRNRREHYEPWYDDRADYNTNSLSYYDYLARFNKLQKVIVDFVNRLLNRDIEVEDTNTIDMTKIGDWIDNGLCTPDGCGSWDDVLKIKGDVKISKKTKPYSRKAKSRPSYVLTDTLKNAITAESDGIYAPDYEKLIGDLIDSIGDILNQIDEIKKEIQALKDRVDALEKRVDGIEKRLNSLEDRISELEKEIKDQADGVEDLRDAIQKIVSNLFQGGAVSSSDITKFTFPTGRHIASGTINFFSKEVDSGKFYIRTDRDKKEGDVSAGIY